MDVIARLEGVQRRYGTTVALDGVSLRLPAGKVTSLLGANGAGKSTAVGVLLGLLAPDAGSASVAGHAPGSLAARQAVGAMLQAAGVPDRLRVREALELARSYHANPRCLADCIAMAGIDGLLDRQYRALSGGQQRRVQFALAICGRPRLLCLDEPTTGLDIDARRSLWAAIGTLVGEGAAVLLTTHYLEEAEALSDHVAVLDHGRIVAEGSVAQIRARVSQRRIRCVSALDADAIGRWPGVRESRRDGELLRIVADSAEGVVRALLAADPQLHDLEVERAGLADAFLDITRATPMEAAA